MANEQCESCASASECGGSCPDVPTKAEQLSNVKQYLAVMSGKGGVGKSSVTALLAVALSKKGYKVGILDADVTGPSIPKLFGITEPAAATEEGIIPRETAGGIKVMSLNLMVPTEDTPVIWRGPIISQLVGQFRTEVVWGELDYLLIDLPPGTGDVPISVFQSFPLNGVVTVTNPQQLAGMVVRKSINMLNNFHLPNYGIIENMAYYQCPDCGKREEIFGAPRGRQQAEEANLAYLGELPIDPRLTELADAGRIADYESELFDGIVEKILTIKE
jgi:Mrp family chromosome partitioning ATPase